MREWTLLRMLWPLVREYRQTIIALVVLGIAAAFSEGIGLSLFVPLLSGLRSTAEPAANEPISRTVTWLFGDIAGQQRLLTIAGCMFALVVLKSFLNYASHVLFAWMDGHLVHRLRSRVIDQLLRVSPQYLDRQGMGTLINTLEGETWITSTALATLVVLLVRCCTIVILTTLLILMSGGLTIAVVAAVLVISVIVQLLSRRVHGLSHVCLRTWEVLSQRCLEVLRGMRTIRTFAREFDEQEHFDRASDEARRACFRMELMKGLVAPISETMTAAVLIVMLAAALYQPSHLPVTLAFILILYRMQPQIQQFDEARISLMAATARVAAVMQLIDPQDKPYIKSGHLPFAGLQDAIRLQQVSFQYEPDHRWALQDVTAVIPARQTTALVGPSGAGKSTFINLLLRFYDPTGGTISIDGKDLSQFDLPAWRRRIAVVSQENHLFNTTIRQNIAYGQPACSEATIVAAARQAGAHEFILQLESGYDTIVGDNGVRLSAGQKQRIAWARAIARNPEIVILDEATHALDAISESLVQEALNTFSRDRTVIIIAHRLSTIRRADQILVLDDGCLREQGTLPELLAQQGLFARLYHLQFENSPAMRDTSSTARASGGSTPACVCGVSLEVDCARPEEKV